MIESNYGSVITVEDGGDGDISLDLGGVKDVLLSPQASIRLGMMLVATALDVLEATR